VNGITQDTKKSAYAFIDVSRSADSIRGGYNSAGVEYTFNSTNDFEMPVSVGTNSIKTCVESNMLPHDAFSSVVGLHVSIPGWYKITYSVNFIVTGSQSVYRFFVVVQNAKINKSTTIFRRGKQVTTADDSSVINKRIGSISKTCVLPMGDTHFARLMMNCDTLNSTLTVLNWKISGERIVQNN
jgi:hypothetical protein